MLGDSARRWRAHWAFLWLFAGCGVSAQDAGGSTRKDAVVQIETGSARCQSGGTCTYNAWSSYVEALHKQATGETIFVSSDYWSFFRWYELFRDRARGSILAAASFREGMGIDEGTTLLLRYGLMLEQDGAPVFNRHAADAIRQLKTEWDSIAETLEQTIQQLEIDSPDLDRSAVQEFVYFYTYASAVWGLGGANGEITAEHQALFDKLLCVAAHRTPGHYDLARGAGLSQFNPFENDNDNDDDTAQPEVVPDCRDVHFLQNEQDPVLQVSGIDEEGHRQIVPLRRLLEPEPADYEDYLALDDAELDRRLHSNVSLTKVQYGNRGQLGFDRPFWRGVQRTLHLGMPVLMSFWVEGPLRSSDHTQFTADYTKDPSIEGAYHSVLIVDYEASREGRTFSFGRLTGSPAPCAPNAPTSLDALLDNDVEVTALQVLNSWGPTAHDNGRLRIETDYLRHAPDDSSAASPARVVDVLIPTSIHLKN